MVTQKIDAFNRRYEEIETNRAVVLKEKTDMDLLRRISDYLTFDNICTALSVIGLIYFVINRFILHRAPVPSSAFKRIPKELLDECIEQLKKQEKEKYEDYVLPVALMRDLQLKPDDEEVLKRLLCSICEHMGIDGNYIELVISDTPVPERAGAISTDLAFTTIWLELRPPYIVDSIIAVLAHEVMHLHLYYEGIRRQDNWENEVLTDTAAVYCGFGEYMYKGYAVNPGEMALSYHKVGYIRQEDVKYIMEVIKKQE